MCYLLLPNLEHRLCEMVTTGARQGAGVQGLQCLYFGLQALAPWSYEPKEGEFSGADLWQGTAIEPPIRRIEYCRDVGGERLLRVATRWLAPRYPKTLTPFPQALARDAKLVCQFCFTHLILMLKHEMLEVVFE